MTRIFYNPEGEGTEAPAGGTPAGSEAPAGQAPATKPEPGPAPAATEQPWYSSLPEDLKADPSVTKFKTPEDLARSYVGLQKMAHNKDPDAFIPVPASDDDGTQRRQVLQKLGLPDNPDGYELQAPKGAPEGFKPDTEMAKAFQQEAHKLGILPDQARGLFEWYGQLTGQTMQGQQAKQQEMVQQNIEALQNDWGDAFDTRVRTANFAVNVLEEKTGVGDGALLQKLNDAGLGNDPTVLKALYEMGRVYSEQGQTAGGERGSTNFGTAPNEARAKGQELLRKAMDARNPAEMRRLNEEAQKYFKLAAKE